MRKGSQHHLTLVQSATFISGRQVDASADSVAVGRLGKLRDRPVGGIQSKPGKRLVAQGQDLIAPPVKNEQLLDEGPKPFDNRTRVGGVRRRLVRNDVREEDVLQYGQELFSVTRLTAIERPVEDFPNAQPGSAAQRFAGQDFVFAQVASNQAYAAIEPAGIENGLCWVTAGGIVSSVVDRKGSPFGFGPNRIDQPLDD